MKLAGPGIQTSDGLVDRGAVGRVGEAAQHGPARRREGAAGQRAADRGGLGPEIRTIPTAARPAAVAGA